MTPRQLKTLGVLLYGRRWKTYLANDLGTDRRTRHVLGPKRVDDAGRARQGHRGAGQQADRRHPRRAEGEGRHAGIVVSGTCPARSGGEARPYMDRHTLRQTLIGIAIIILALVAVALVAGLLLGR
jgi:hypothetical protein